MQHSNSMSAFPMGTARKRVLRSFLFLLVCIATCTSVAAESPIHGTAASPPQVAISHFQSLPGRVSYFEDSSVVLYHDSTDGVVFRSEDEGKSWSPVVGPKPKEAYMLMEHPYDGKTAFILSDAKTHWRTVNRGKTWQMFETPEPPAIRAGAPLEFHADPKHWDHIIYTGKKCVPSWNPWAGSLCHDEAYYTEDGFASPVKPLMEYLMHCTWAKISKEVVIAAEHLKRIYCIAFEDSVTPGTSTKPTRTARSVDNSTAPPTMREAPAGPTRLFYSDDYFKTRHLVSLDLGRDARNFVGFGPSSKFLITAMRDLSSSTAGNAGEEMAMFVSRDGDKWEKAKFPHGHGLRENSYTIVEGTSHSLVVDVLDSASPMGGGTGVLFSSDSTGTQFVQSLEGTRRNRQGIVDFEHLANIEGVALANVIRSPKTGGTPAVRTLITHDDGSTWRSLQAPKYDGVRCDVADTENCALHLHSVTQMHNIGRVFSSVAPGFVMGVGSVGSALRPYEECDTFLSRDAGTTWRMVEKDAHKYEFGDNGGLLVLVDDENSVDHIKYSLDEGRSWHELKLGVNVRAKALTTIPDNTAQKFLLIGSVARDGVSDKGRYVTVFLDFAAMGRRKCIEADFEKWYANPSGPSGGECLMGHRQWFKRRKAEADCFVGDKFQDPVGREEPCACTAADYECDYGFVRDSKGECTATGTEPIPVGSCRGADKTFKGSSGYRKIPGNTCAGGLTKDQPVDKPCAQGKPQAGNVAHQRHDFKSPIFDHMYFPNSPNVMIQTVDGTIWSSTNDGYSWKVLFPPEVPLDPQARFLTMVMHEHDTSRAYLVTSGQYVYYTTDRGVNWQPFKAPVEANGLGIPLLDFHPSKSDWLIWTGSRDCTSTVSQECRSHAYYTTDHGREWHPIEKYVKTCAWARDAHFKADPTTILCESYDRKSGSQRNFALSGPNANSLALVAGSNYYRTQKKIFTNIVGFTTFAEFLIVAEYLPATSTLRLQISLDAQTFHIAEFPTDVVLDNHAYTVLDSVTKAVFLHMTVNSKPGAEWGSIFKSNSNGTYYALSLDKVNRDSRGFVDFEKMMGLNGVAVVNVVSNADHASVSGSKKLQTRITHNDGGHWKVIAPPAVDSLGSAYPCNRVGCNLNFHGYTERKDPSATYSSPSGVGLMIAVGNVGTELAPYQDSDTFLTRDGGFNWEEIRKDAHMWEFGDQGSIIILVDDERPTDRVLYSLDQGKKWQTYNFGASIRAQAIVTVPEDTKRKFILFGAEPGAQARSMAIHLDFSAVQSRKCVANSDPNKSDFELWSPSEQRAEPCLFGRQTFYTRRKREADCYVGAVLPQPASVEKNCSCTDQDFECEFNHYRDSKGACVSMSSTLLVADEWEQCKDGADYWYDRTTVRKIPMSSCEGGSRPDRGPRHVCSASTKRHGGFWWTTIVLSPFALAGLVGYWWSRKGSGRSGGSGSIRLPDASTPFSSSPTAQTLASIPSFVAGLASITWGSIVEISQRLPGMSGVLSRPNRGSYGGYRTLSTDEDAEILRDYEDEEFDR